MKKTTTLVVGWCVVILQMVIFWPELQETVLPVYVGLGMGWVAALIVEVLHECS